MAFFWTILRQSQADYLKTLRSHFDFSTWIMKLFGLSKGLNSGDVFPFLKGTIGTKGDGFIVFPDFFQQMWGGLDCFFFLIVNIQSQQKPFTRGVLLEVVPCAWNQPNDPFPHHLRFMSVISIVPRQIGCVDVCSVSPRTKKVDGFSPRWGNVDAEMMITQGVLGVPQIP